MQDLFKSKRQFYWSTTGAIHDLIRQTILVPLGGDQIVRRRQDGVPRRKYDVIVGDTRHRIELLDWGNGWMVQCNSDSLKVVYRVFVEAGKARTRNLETKTIVKPVLPQSIFDLLEANVFDFLRAIKELKTTNGFGNVGLIFNGPPGVGKSETMRWISERAHEEFGRKTHQLSFVKLQQLLSEGVELNTDGDLLMMDDIDANLLRSRKETRNPLTGQFLTCIDGLDKREGRVMIVSTNEVIDDMDPALLRPGRFEHVVRFEYPTNGLIQQFLDERDIKLSAAMFTDWSFARLDMFLARFKVANYRFGTSMDAFYEKFIYEMGEEDKTVSAYAEYGEV